METAEENILDKELTIEAFSSIFGCEIENFECKWSNGANFELACTPRRQSTLCHIWLQTIDAETDPSGSSGSLPNVKTIGDLMVLKRLLGRD